MANNDDSNERNDSHGRDEDEGELSPTLNHRTTRVGLLC